MSTTITAVDTIEQPQKPIAPYLPRAQRSQQSLSQPENENIELSVPGDARSPQGAVAEDETVKLTKDTYFKLLSAGFSFFFAGASDGCLGALVPYILRTYRIETDMVAVMYEPLAS